MWNSRVSADLQRTMALAIVTATARSATRTRPMLDGSPVTLFHHEEVAAREPSGLLNCDRCWPIGAGCSADAISDDVGEIQVRRLTSVFGRSLQTLDDEHFDGARPGLQFEAELLPKSFA